MLPLLDSLSDFEKVDPNDYGQRNAAAVAFLARLCDRDPTYERSRFLWCGDCLSAEPSRSGADAGFVQAVASRLPLFFELVLTLADRSPRGFAYLTQGRLDAALPENMARLLAASLRILLESGGRAGDAGCLADLFRNAFPKLSRLEEHSPLAQGMLVALVPAARQLDLKVYLNTRIYPAIGHRARVQRMLAQVGLEGGAFYDALYERLSGVHFHGIGVDVGKQRGKLYVRTQRDRRFEILTELQAALRCSAPEVVEPCEDLLSSLTSSAIGDRVEIAAALRANGAASAKLTLFYLPGERRYAEVLAYLSRIGYRGTWLDSLGEWLDGGAAAVHGIGIEVPVGERPKVNLYLRVPL